MEFYLRNRFDLILQQDQKTIFQENLLYSKFQIQRRRCLDFYLTQILKHILFFPILFERMFYPLYKKSL